MRSPVFSFADADLAFGSLGGLSLSVWRRGASVPQALGFCRMFDEVIATHPRGGAFLMVIEDGAAAPAAEVRSILVKRAVAAGTRLKAGAVVHEGQGFQASVVRAVVTSMGLIVRKAYPEKVFARLDESAAWIAGLMTASDPGAPSAAEIMAAVAAIRGRIG
jgi:hypothetical protein